MYAELIVATGVFFSCLGVMSAEPMFPLINRPVIFRGKWGEWFFTLVTALIFLGALSLLIWSFLNVTWYVNLLVLVGSFLLSAFAIQLLPPFLIHSAFGPSIAAVGLIALHHLAWFSPW